MPQAIVCQIAVVYEYFYRLQEEGGAGVTDYVNYYYILSSTVDLDWKKIVFLASDVILPNFLSVILFLTSLGEERTVAIVYDFPLFHGR